MTIEEKQNEIIEEFAIFSEWMEKYEHLIEMGKELKPLNSIFKTDEHLVKGCQSQVWLVAKHNNGKLYFEADSDALITKGIIGLLVRVFSGHSAKEIMDANLVFIEKIGLSAHLSPNRANGLASMIKKIKTYAVAYSAINN